MTVVDPGDQTRRVGSTIIPVTLTGSDSSPVAHLTWSATGLPTGLTIGASSGTISGSTPHAGVFRSR